MEMVEKETRTIVVKTVTAVGTHIQSEIKVFCYSVVLNLPVLLKEIIGGDNKFK